ncbi:MAG: GatB/YqeY domain-containing protein [Candidatus Neomarinimicrobiota bacterium]
MSLFDTIQQDMYVAMKAGEKARVATLRVALAGLKDKRIAARGDISAADEIKVLQTLVRQHHESLESYRAGGRPDLVALEEAELAVLTAYLPSMLSEAEVRSLVTDAIAETGAAGMSDLGKVMPLVMQRAAGRADGKLAQALVRELLAG